MSGLDGSEIYEKYADELVRFATGVVGPSDAQDAVSAAVLRCVTSASWATVQNHRAYLYRAVLREAKAEYRSTMRRRARELRAAMPEEAPAAAPEVRPEVLDAVGRLSVRQRAAVVLTYWADMTPGAIADLLGISEGAVRRHLARARARLREMLDG